MSYHENRMRWLEMTSPKDVYEDAIKTYETVGNCDNLIIAGSVCMDFNTPEGFKYGRRLHRYFTERPSSGWWTVLAWISGVKNGKRNKVSKTKRSSRTHE